MRARCKNNMSINAYIRSSDHYMRAPPSLAKLTGLRQATSKVTYKRIFRSRQSPHTPGSMVTQDPHFGGSPFSPNTGIPLASLVTSPRAPPGEKRSGEQSRISWAYSPKR